MWETKKKLFPKLKKKLKGFITDESGKITKKDALGLAAWAVLLSGVEDVVAGHTSWWVPWGHSSWYDRWGHLSQWHASAVNRWGHLSVNPWPVTKTAHCSWIVNWHYSWTPNWGTYDPSHTSWYKWNGWHVSQWHANWYIWNGWHKSWFINAWHASHNSHWSWGWC